MFDFVIKDIFHFTFLSKRHFIRLGFKKKKKIISISRIDSISEYDQFNLIEIFHRPPG